MNQILIETMTSTHWNHTTSTDTLPTEDAPLTFYVLDALELLLNIIALLLNLFAT